MAACGAERMAHDATRRMRAQHARRKRAPRLPRTDSLALVKMLEWIRFCLDFILAIGSITDSGFGWRRCVVPCKSYDTRPVSPLRTTSPGSVSPTPPSLPQLPLQPLLTELRPPPVQTRIAHLPPLLSPPATEPS
jgi:hypothetical protein